MNTYGTAKKLVPARPLKCTRVPQQNGPNMALPQEHQVIYNTLRASSNKESSASSRGSYSNNYANTQGVLRSRNSSFSSERNTSTEEPTVIATYNSATLPIGSSHEAYVTYIVEGPKLFSIHLKENEAKLDGMMSKLDNMQGRLKHLNCKPSLGMACIARFSEDKQLYRALIINTNVESCLVLYVDYGNSENVMFGDLYEIPSELLRHKIFAMRFTLSNVKMLQDSNVDVAQIFENMVMNKDLLIKVVPLEGPPFVQYCEIYVDNRNIFDELLRKSKGAPLKFPPPIKFRQEQEMVVIRYIQSVKQFFVQPLRNCAQFHQMMDKLAEHCGKKGSSIESFSIGDPCAIYCENEWFRAQIISADGPKIKVRLVDYGNRIDVDRSLIKSLPFDFVSYEPQAIECCLTGFETLPEDDLSTDQLEMLSEDVSEDRKPFKLTVINQMPDVFIVNLLDESVSPIVNISKSLLKLKHPANYQHQKDQKDFNNKPNNVMNSTPINEAALVQDKSIEVIDLTGDESAPQASSSGYDNNSYNNNNYNNNQKKNSRADIPRFNKDKNDQRTTNHYHQYDETNNYQDSETSGIHSNSTKTSKSANSIEPEPEYVSYSQQFTDQIVPMNTKTPVVITAWHLPDKFYFRIKSDEANFDNLTQALQQFYATKMASAQAPPIGAPIVAKYPKDNCFYRAILLEYNYKLDKYKAECVDTGKIIIITMHEIYKVEKKFMENPRLAIECALPNIKILVAPKELAAKIDDYLCVDSEIECEFLEKVGQKYSSNVEVDGEDLKTTFVKDSIVCQIYTDIDLLRLKGQTLKIKIIEVKNLEQFKIKICGNDAIFSCSCIDESASKELDEIKTNWLGKYCTAKIEDVCLIEQKLKISLLIPLLTNQPPPTIVNMPVLQNNFDVYVSFIENCNSLYVQNAKWAEEIAKLLDDMFDCYEHEGNLISNLAINEICAAKSADGNWYRAQIMNLQDIDSVGVFYVDYGNTENVKHSDLKVLESQFNEFSAFAHKVRLPVDAAENVDHDSILNEISLHTLENKCSLTILLYKNDTIIIDLVVNENQETLISLLKNKQLVKDVDFEEFYVRKIVEECNGIKLVQEDVQNNNTNISENDETVKAIISHVDTPNQFFIQMSSDLSDLDQFQENLQIVAPSLPQLRDFSEGKYCVSQYQADDLWYRAKIIDSHDDLIIQFIDYGNTDVITSNKKNELKDINDSLMKFKIYSKQCALLIGPKSSSWSEAANEKLFDVDESVDVEFVLEVKNLNYVKLSHDSKDLTEQYLEEEMGVKLEYVPSGENCFTSHINSIKDFYVQLDKNSEGLEVMAAYLVNDSNLIELNEVKEGAYCVALFDEDSCWYRAKILSIENNEYEVHFIDYGNTSAAKQIRYLKDKEIMELPPLCTKCSLQIPDNITKWSPEAEEKFIDMAMCGETVFTVETVNPGKRAVIQLFLNGKNVVEELVPLCQKGTHNIMDTSIFLTDDKLDESFHSESYVQFSHVNTPADFFVHLKSNSNGLKNMEELLANNVNKYEPMTPKETVFDANGVAFIPKYDKYFRVKILNIINANEYNVLLMDYGQTITATDLKKMPQNLSNIDFLAKRCCLELYYRTDISECDPSSIKFKELAEKNSKKMFRCEFVTTQCYPVEIVRLYDEDNKSVEDLIESCSHCKTNGEAKIYSNGHSSSEFEEQKKSKPKQCFLRNK